MGSSDFDPSLNAQGLDAINSAQKPMIGTQQSSQRVSEFPQSPQQAATADSAVFNPSENQLDTLQVRISQFPLAGEDHLAPDYVAGQTHFLPPSGTISLDNSWYDP